MIYLKIIYAIISLVFITLQGPYYYFWHNFTKPNKTDLKEILLNSLGSIVGWGAGYFLLFYRLQNGFKGFNPGIAELIIFLIAFYGMTGYLPHILINKLKLGK